MIAKITNSHVLMEKSPNLILLCLNSFLFCFFFFHRVIFKLNFMISVAISRFLKFSFWTRRRFCMYVLVLSIFIVYDSRHPQNSLSDLFWRYWLLEIELVVLATAVRSGILHWSTFISPQSFHPYHFTPVSIHPRINSSRSYFTPYSLHSTFTSLQV